MKRQPPDLHVLSGTARARNTKFPESPAKALEAVPEPPQWLQGADARQHWFDVLPVLVARRMVSETDLASFALVCMLYGRIVDQAKSGAPFRGTVVSKYLALAGEFGLTPLSASKLRPLAAPAKRSSFSAFRPGGNNDPA